MKGKGSQFGLSADDMGKPVQLPMFMPAQEFRDSITTTADMPAYSPDEVYDIKLTDSMAPKQQGQHGSGVFSSVQEKGVLNPVQMVHGDNDLMLGDGHHRAAAADFDAGLPQPGAPNKTQWLPLVHTDARSGTKVASAETEEAPGIRSIGVRRAAVADANEFNKNTGSYYRETGTGSWTA